MTTYVSIYRNFPFVWLRYDCLPLHVGLRMS